MSLNFYVKQAYKKSILLQAKKKVEQGPKTEKFSEKAGKKKRDTRDNEIGKKKRQ